MSLYLDGSDIAGRVASDIVHGEVTPPHKCDLNEKERQGETMSKRPDIRRAIQSKHTDSSEEHSRAEDRERESNQTSCTVLA